MLEATKRLRRSRGRIGRIEVARSELPLMESGSIPPSSTAKTRQDSGRWAGAEPCLEIGRLPDGECRRARKRQSQPCGRLETLSRSSRLTGFAAGSTGTVRRRPDMQRSAGDRLRSVDHVGACGANQHVGRDGGGLAATKLRPCRASRSMLRRRRPSRGHWKLDGTVETDLSGYTPPPTTKKHKHRAEKRKAKKRKAKKRKTRRHHK
jgi:hypothetical protein